MHESLETTESAFIPYQLYEEETRLGNAGGGPLTKVRAEVNGTEGWFVRKYCGPNKSLSYVEKTNYLKGLGFPVIDALAINPNQILVPDLTEDGSHLYGKYEMHFLKLGARTRIPTDQTIQNISSETINDLVHPFVNLANSNRVGLSVDDPFELRVGPNGQFDLVMLDLKLVGLNHDISRNIKIQPRFLQIIMEIQYQLKNNFYLNR